jgi:hypothetical protein
MQSRDLNLRLHDQPFRAFRIHLSDGSSLAVTHGGMVLVGESSVVLPTELDRDSDGYPIVKRWRTVALSHMVQFSDLDEPVSGKRKKKNNEVAHPSAVPCRSCLCVHAWTSRTLMRFLQLTRDGDHAPRKQGGETWRPKRV